tara:strand:+ start:163 stop:357 length:195 start_codon:yes stop_codon:yes gene_type:complete
MMSKNLLPHDLFKNKLVIDSRDSVDLAVQPFTKNSLMVITANGDDVKDMDWNEYKKLVKFIFRK